MKELAHFAINVAGVLVASVLVIASGVGLAFIVMGIV